MKQMTDEELRAYVSTCVRQAVGYEDSEITQDRETNLKYYRGEPFGNERAGRSDFVSRDVMDTIEWIMPALMEMFHGTEQPVEFAPRSAEDVEFAKQATDYVNYVYNHDNEGYRITQTAMKEGLIQKMGAVKHWWERAERIEESEHHGLTEDQVAMLAGAADVEVAGTQARDVQIDTPQGPMPIRLYDIRVRRRIREGRIRVEAVPVEEVLVSPRATSAQTADFLGHRTRISRSKLIAMGFDRETVENLPADDGAAEDSERVTRYEPEDGFANVGPKQDKSVEEVTVTEAWLLVDFDGDGIAERRQIMVAGASEQVLLSNELVTDDAFMTVWSPILMPHTVWGMAAADAVRDLQEIKSMILRQMLDGLMLSNFPRTEVVEGMVNLDDLLTYRPGGVVRVKAPNQMREMGSTWQGAQAFPMLQWLDQTRDGRTGVSQMGMGIDADALNNNAGKQANEAFMTAAQARVKLIARNFAEFFFKPLFRSILRLAVTYQDAPRVVRLTNGFEQVDPRTWNADMDVIVNVGLGTGDKAQRIAALQGVMAIQTQAIAAGGLDGMVAPENVYAAVTALQRAAGLGALPLFNQPTPPDPNAPKPPDPETEQIRLKAEADAAKMQMDAQIQAQRIAADEAMQARRLEMEERVAMARLVQEAALKERQILAEIELKERQLLAEITLKRELAAAQSAQTASTSEVAIGGNPG